MKKLLTLICLSMAMAAAWADSPLTSTRFWMIYLTDSTTLPQYEQFNEFGWGPEVQASLCNPDISVEHRLCLVNLIGWDIDGQTHYPELMEYYMKQHNCSSQKEALKQMDGLTLTVFAYVKAMDDYFHVKEAKRLSAEAMKRAPESRAAAMINALIIAEIALDHNWNDIYPACKKVIDNPNLNNDFSDAAIEVIMEYINLYRGGEGE